MLRFSSPYFAQIDSVKIARSARRKASGTEYAQPNSRTQTPNNKRRLNTSATSTKERKYDAARKIMI